MPPRAKLVVGASVTKGKRTGVICASVKPGWWEVRFDDTGATEQASSRGLKRQGDQAASPGTQPGLHTALDQSEDEDEDEGSSSSESEDEPPIIESEYLAKRRKFEEGYKARIGQTVTV